MHPFTSAFSSVSTVLVPFPYLGVGLSGLSGALSRSFGGRSRHQAVSKTYPRFYICNFLFPPSLCIPFLHTLVPNRRFSVSVSSVFDCFVVLFALSSVLKLTSGLYSLHSLSPALSFASVSCTVSCRIEFFSDSARVYECFWLCLQ